MGYNTSYELYWEPQKSCELSKMKLDAKVGKYIADHEEMSYALAEDGSTEERCKWYDWKDDMKTMSTKFKDVLFHLSGEGEESGDIWDAWFLNGKAQVHEAEIIRKEAPVPKDWE
jgi:hypothetical protein